MIADAFRRLPFRLRRGLEAYGPGGLVREGIGRVVRSADNFVWYVLDLDRVEPIPFRPGYEIREAARDEAAGLMRVVPAIPAAEARERVSAGVRLWVVEARGEPAFVCFSFDATSGPFPLEAARRGRYVLPEGVVCLENGLTRREFRGRLIAPAAWASIGERLREEGMLVLMTKIEVDNAASRRTAEKTGFRAASVMSRRRSWFRTRVVFADEGNALTAAERAAADDLVRAISR